MKILYSVIFLHKFYFNFKKCMLQLQFCIQYKYYNIFK